MLKTYFNLLRVDQWIKNSFLFVPLFFAGDLFKTTKILHLIVGFFSFSLVASAIYIINDYRDRENDRKHPTKKLRPIAAGKVSITTSFVIMTICLLAGLTLGYFLEYRFMIMLLIYLAINISYSLGLKRVAILDMVMVSSGFVIRVISGGIIAEVPLSQWLIVMVYLLSLFIVLAKRRDDVYQFTISGNLTRKSVTNYSLEYMTATLVLISGVIIVSYLMYCLSPEANIQSSYLYATSLFVISGILRYLQITIVDNKSGSPTRILYKDKFSMVNLILWVISFYIIIYTS
ncbi:decaprenyl-phosphate phosphoribosyltransferase [Marinigracilibium pacificum]|uniref:Decaprenyl-phosphate phosphoribosyltransferase n=1 Tax=Marinigracilibium pacificum TaxID=2729599 RepID=A0A848IVM9_9BACT|nr:decaprenyl-phosphate phosphoribosyltransferase [Marinigracilibium pacificum]NMM47238.1 decaprenyl-phosphate phosphoribosyltransferase [Marinigracilibium pacificum]